MKDVYMTIVASEITTVETLERKDAYTLQLDGKTYQHKEEIKAMGFEWNGDFWEKTEVVTTMEAMRDELQSFINTGFITIDKMSQVNIYNKYFA